MVKLSRQILPLAIFVTRSAVRFLGMRVHRPLLLMTFWTTAGEARVIKARRLIFFVGNGWVFRAAGKHDPNEDDATGDDADFDE